MVHVAEAQFDTWLNVTPTDPATSPIRLPDIELEKHCGSLFSHLRVIQNEEWARQLRRVLGHERSSITMNLGLPELALSFDDKGFGLKTCTEDGIRVGRFLTPKLRNAIKVLAINDLCIEGARGFLMAEARERDIRTPAAMPLNKADFMSNESHASGDTPAEALPAVVNAATQRERKKGF